MKSFQKLLLLIGWLSISAPLLAQLFDTPPVDFDRSTDQAYVDTPRMEYLHFLAYDHYSGMAHRDNAPLIADQLIRLAERRLIYPTTG